MSHLLIMVEGNTEADVMGKFLKPYWSRRFQTAEILNYGGEGSLKMNFARDAQIQLQQESDSSVLCLVDLYNESFGVYQRGKMTPADGFIAVQKLMLSLVDERFYPRFGAFPVVMELEAWLCVDLHPAPEEILHPAEFLKSKRGRYSKTVDGKNLFGATTAEKVYQDNCPHFVKLIDWLVNEPPKLSKQSTAEQQRQRDWDSEFVRLNEQVETLDAAFDGTQAHWDTFMAARQALNEHLRRNS